MRTRRPRIGTGTAGFFTSQRSPFMHATTHPQPILLALPPTMPMEALRAALKPLNVSLVYPPDPRPAPALQAARQAGRRS
jgi:hypothetical protein